MCFCAFEIALFSNFRVLKLNSSVKALENSFLDSHKWHLFKKNSLPAQCSKIGKKCNFKSSKTHFLQFQKLHKINYCTRKKFETTKNAILPF